MQGCRAIIAGLLGAGVVLALTTSAQAQFVVPTSYTATPAQGQAQGGSFNYFDDGGVQLTDGILGANDWAANLGNGNAYEWVGWISVDPTMTFTFSAPVNITQVQIGFNRGGGGVNLPTTVTVNGGVTNLTGEEISLGTRGFLNFNTTFTGNNLIVSLADNNAGSWIFVDEVRFVGAPVASSAPEPGTLALLGMGMLGGMVVLKKRRHA
jgi:hypothetical protein